MPGLRRRVRAAGGCHILDYPADNVLPWVKKHLLEHLLCFDEPQDPLRRTRIGGGIRRHHPGCIRCRWSFAPEIDQDNLGVLEIKFRSLNDLSGIIHIEADWHDDDLLWLDMNDDDGSRTVDSILYPHDEEGEEDDADEDDSDEKDTDDSPSESDNSDDYNSSSDSDSGISAATLHILTQTTLQMTMLATAMMTDQFDSALLLRMAQ